MPKKMCLDCGVISEQSRCRKHRTRQSRGYDKYHDQYRRLAIAMRPYCWNCGCPVTNCKLELHHVEPLQGGRNSDMDDRRQLLCTTCHNKVKEK